MTKKAIFTLEARSMFDLMDDGNEAPFTLDCFYVTQSHYDFGDLDPRKLPDDLNPLNEESIKADIGAMSGIMMRRRFASGTEGPFIINVPDCYNYLERRDVEEIIGNWFRDGILKEKLKEAKI